MMMLPSRISVLVITTISLLLLVAQSRGEQCINSFTKGKEDFTLDTDESVKQGAEFLASPSLTGSKDCMLACCSYPNCNLALMESDSQDGTIKSCFLFNCLYKQKKVCSFVHKKGFSNYILTSVFDSYLKEYDQGLSDHPPRAVAGQDRVVQPSESVILTGVESQDDKKIVKYEWVEVSGSPNIVMSKTTFEDEVKVSKMSPGVYKFKLTVTDDAGQSDSSEVTVLVLTPEQSLHHCLVPKKVGPCRGAFARWHYNALTEKCETFNYGGCNPNRNNYLSEDECKQACDHVSVHKTSGRHGPIDHSEACGVTCGPEKLTCDNGCCIDKELECDQVQQCSDGSDEAHCANMDSKFRRLLDINEGDNKAIAASHCTQPPVTGTCRDSNTKWYYNPYDQKCLRFNFGGCNGNDNQFDSEDSCMKLCSKVTEKDAFANRYIFEKQTDDGHSVSIAIAVALGLAILILLVVLGYCYLKDKKQRSRHQRISNGAHLLPVDDSEKLVYNSTTKPI